jgi:hypothetical protein
VVVVVVAPAQEMAILGDPVVVVMPGVHHHLTLEEVLL